MRTMHQTLNKIYVLLCTIGILSIFVFLSNSTFALDYQSSTNVQFTFNPTISVSVSGDLNIDELVPGSSKDSNIIDVNVSTNNVSGYNLSATTGNSTNATTNLTHANNTNTFTSLSTTDNISSMDNIDVSSNGKWGYSYSNDNGTTWINGTGGTGYSGLPLYTSTGTILKQTYNAANDIIKFKIGAKASNTQVTGDYTNIINFIAVANQSPVSFYDAFSAAGKTQYNGYYKMQDMTSTICNNVQIEGDDSAIDLIDIRDNEVYKIAKLKDDNCWMLDNLRLGGDDPITLTNQDTNMVAESWVLPKDDHQMAIYYTHPLLKSTYKNDLGTNWGIGNGKIGVYYNYCALTAGTYCYSDESGVGNAEYDICPDGWKIFSINDFTILSEQYGSSDATDPNSVQHAFSFTGTGYVYSNSYQQNIEYGYLWSSSYGNSSRMYHPLLSKNWIRTDDSDERNLQIPARCIAK